MGVLWDIFINSIRLPMKKAAFALNRIGMDMIIIYMFILLALFSLPGFIEQFLEGTAAAELHVKFFFHLIFFFIFYYLIIVFILLAVVSIIAYFGVWFARVVKRKLRYAILWKMTACIMTIPILLYTAIAFFYSLSYYFLLYALIFHLIIFSKTILLYPRRRHLKP